jgi:putative nucleotidyltransferase with HDIG domain
MSREDSKKLLREHLKNENLIKHCVAVAAIMDGLADHFSSKGEEVDKENWWACGLLHDMDYEATKDDMHAHSKIAAKILEEKAYPVEVVRAVLVHNDTHGLPQETLMERALVAADDLSGLIVASTLVLPDKKLASLSPESVLKRFKEKAFARGVNREGIKSCEKIGLSLEEFAELGIKSMQAEAQALGL